MSLAHLVTEDMLEWSFRQLRKDAAIGVDEVTWGDYAHELSSNLRALHERLRTWNTARSRCGE
jgi:hypothetical protein